MEYARVRVTARGNPSGIATTTMVTAAAMIPTTELITSSAFVLLPLNSLFPFSSVVCPVKYRTNKTTSTRNATAKPTFPMDEVSLFNLVCNGVSSLLSNCLLCRKLLRAETEITRNTARNMLPPSYHPSLIPSSLIPNARDKTAQAKRMRIVGSLNASQTKWKRFLAGGLLLFWKHFPGILQIFVRWSFEELGTVILLGIMAECIQAFDHRNCKTPSFLAY
nr:hypothetical protein RchiOBHm_Chr4g0388571 [Ipomoea batatas]